MTSFAPNKAAQRLTVLNEARDFRDRRMLWPAIPGKAKQSFTVPKSDYTYRHRLQKWIKTHTSGPYYLSHDLLYFELEADALMFKLSDHVKRDFEKYGTKS